MISNKAEAITYFTQLRQSYIHLVCNFTPNLFSCYAPSLCYNTIAYNCWSLLRVSSA